MNNDVVRRTAPATPGLLIITVNLEQHSDVFSTLYILRVLKSDLQKSKYYDIPHSVLVTEPCYGLSGFLAESPGNIHKNIEASLSKVYFKNIAI